MVVDRNSNSVQTYIQSLQNIISRLANNSANCKTWSITIVSAILVLAIDKDKILALKIGFIPLFVFMIIDAYYLALEKAVRNIYDSFVDKLNKDTAKEEDIFMINPKLEIGQVICCVSSFSVWPFYLIIFLAIVIAKYFI